MRSVGSRSSRCRLHRQVRRKARLCHHMKSNAKLMKLAPSGFMRCCMLVSCEQRMWQLPIASDRSGTLELPCTGRLPVVNCLVNCCWCHVSEALRHTRRQGEHVEVFVRCSRRRTYRCRARVRTCGTVVWLQRPFWHPTEGGPHEDLIRTVPPAHP